MRANRLAIPLLLLTAATLAQAQSQGQALDATSVLEILKTSLAPAVAKLTSHAISWLGVFATLQFAVTNYKLLTTDADLQTHVAKAVAAIAWVGFCLYLIDNGPEFLRGVSDQMMGLLGVDIPSPGSIMAVTSRLAAGLAVTAVGVGAVPFVGGTAGMILTYVMFGVLLVGFYFAFKIFMLQLEIALIAMIAPLSFSFLGLNTLRDQGIAPFKALISLSYRIIIVTMILAAYSNVSGVLRDAITSTSKDSVLGGGIEATLDLVVSSIGVYLLLAYLMFKSDAIAATLAAGSTSMGTGDVAQAAAAGAALGAAISTGGAAAGAVAGRAPQSMSDFVSRMMGGGAISNGSAMGNGGDGPSMPPPPPSASASLSLSGMQGSSPSGASGAADSGVTPSGERSQGGSAPHTAPGRSASSVGVTSGRYGVDSSTDGAGDGGSAANPGSRAQHPSPTSDGTSNGAPSTLKDMPGVSTGQTNADRVSSSTAGSPAEASIGGPTSEDTATPAVAPTPDLGRSAKALGSALLDLGRHLQHQSTETRVSVNAHDQH